MRKRVLLLLVPLCLAILAVFIPQYLRAYCSYPHSPRPIFCEWELLDLGWGWYPDNPEMDRRGTVMYTDRTLNLVVVVATGCEDCPGGNDLAPDYATLFWYSPYETTIYPMKNTLYVKVFPEGAEGRFRLKAGTALAIHKRCEIDFEAPSDILQALPELYDGDNREELVEFLEPYIRMGEGASVAPESQAARREREAVNTVP